MEAIAKLRNSPFPARKMRLLADLIRGQYVEEALQTLRYHPKRMYATQLEKLLLSAVSNWEQKAESEEMADISELRVSHISVDGARVLKRIRPAPQGRAHRIRKRFNHITVKVADTQDQPGELQEEDSPETNA